MLAWFRRWLGILTDDELQALDHRDEQARRATWPILDRAFPPSDDDTTPARDSKHTLNS